MQLQTIVYTTDMDRAVSFWSSVLAAEPAMASPSWTSFPMGTAHLAIHWVPDLPPTGRVAVSLVADGLEAVEQRLIDEGVAITRGIRDEPFGRSLVVTDPDGSPIQINEH